MTINWNNELELPERSITILFVNTDASKESTNQFNEYFLSNYFFDNKQVHLTNLVTVICATDVPPLIKVWHLPVPCTVLRASFAHPEGLSSQVVFLNQNTNHDGYQRQCNFNQMPVKLSSCLNKVRLCPRHCRHR